MSSAGKKFRDGVAGTDVVMIYGYRRDNTDTGIYFEVIMVAV